MYWEAVDCVLVLFTPAVEAYISTPCSLQQAKAWMARSDAAMRCGWPRNVGILAGIGVTAQRTWRPVFAFSRSTKLVNTQLFGVTAFRHMLAAWTGEVLHQIATSSRTTVVKPRVNMAGLRHKGILLFASCCLLASARALPDGKFYAPNHRQVLHRMLNKTYASIDQMLACSLRVHVTSAIAPTFVSRRREQMVQSCDEKLSFGFNVEITTVTVSPAMCRSTRYQVMTGTAWVTINGTCSETLRTTYMLTSLPYWGTTSLAQLYTQWNSLRSSEHGKPEAASSVAVAAL